MGVCSFPPEFAPQELPLKSLSCVSSTGGVDVLLTAVRMYLKSHVHFQQGFSSESSLSVTLHFCRGMDS